MRSQRKIKSDMLVDPEGNFRVAKLALNILNNRICAAAAICPSCRNPCPECRAGSAEPVLGQRVAGLIQPGRKFSLELPQLTDYKVPIRPEAAPFGLRGVLFSVSFSSSYPSSSSYSSSSL